MEHLLGETDNLCVAQISESVVKHMAGHLGQSQATWKVSVESVSAKLTSIHR